MKIINDDGMRVTKRDVSVGDVVARELTVAALQLTFATNRGGALSLILDPEETHNLWKALDQLKDVFFEASEEEI